MPQTTPPQPNELELSVFGPGIGECLVLHLGNDTWIVIDSCLNEAGDRPIAIQYLESLNVDVANKVVAVVATHWHDDHIKGLSDVFDAATSARFVCSLALNAREFYTLVDLSRNVKLAGHDKGISEFGWILETINNRLTSNYRMGPSWAMEGRQIHRQTSPFDVDVIAISPSDQTITDFKMQLASQIPKVGTMVHRFPSITPNDSSVAIIVKTSSFNLLLGADLERGQDNLRGWRAAIQSNSLSGVTCGGFKVAHHGSPDAHLPAVWTNLLIANCPALLTPYAKGSTPRPAPDDVQRIKALTNSAYISTGRPRIKPPRRLVDGTMKRYTRSRFAYQKKPGQIRMRIPVGQTASTPVIELFDGAVQL